VDEGAVSRGDALDRDLTSVWGALTRILPSVRFERRDGYVVISYPRLPSALINGVWSAGDPALSADELAGLLDEIEATGAQPGVCIRDGEAPSLEQLASRLELTERHEVPGMAVTQSTFRPFSSPSLEIVRVLDAPGLEVALEVASAGFEIPREMLEELYTSPMLDHGAHIYVGSSDGSPVTTALFLSTGLSAGVFSVATPPADRGRGYAAAVTSRVVGDAFEAGADTAWLQSSPMAVGVYSGLGFETVTMYELWTKPSALVA